MRSMVPFTAAAASLNVLWPKNPAEVATLAKPGALSFCLREGKGGRRGGKEGRGGGGAMG